MIELCIANGIELVPMSWDQLPALVRGAVRAASAPSPSFLGSRRLPVAQRVDCPALEEDPERWDGLS